MTRMFSRRHYENRLFMSVEGRRFCRLNNVWMDVFYSWTYRWQPYAHISPLWPKTYRGAGCCPLPPASQYPLLVKTWGWKNGGDCPTSITHSSSSSSQQHICNTLYQEQITSFTQSYTSLSPTPAWVLHQTESYTRLQSYTSLSPTPALYTSRSY